MVVGSLALAVQAHRMETRAKVLTFDIERRPQIGAYWDARTTYIGRGQQLIRSSTISWAAKWYDEPDTIYASVGEGDNLFRQPEHTAGYREMIAGIRDLLDQADIVVGYNSARFDEKRLRGEWVRLGIKDPSPFRTLDIFRTVKSLGWDYASLAETLAAFGLEGKTSHQGFALWLDFMRGDPEARALMEEYNRNDVTQTELALDCLRPYIKDHPNLNLWSGNDEAGNPVEVCTNCGHANLKVAPNVTTALTQYGGVKCGNCGHSMRRNFVKERTTLRTAR